MYAIVVMKKDYEFCNMQHFKNRIKVLSLFPTVLIREQFYTCKMILRIFLTIYDQRLLPKLEIRFYNILSSKTSCFLPTTIFPFHNMD